MATSEPTLQEVDAQNLVHVISEPQTPVIHIMDPETIPLIRSKKRANTSDVWDHFQKIDNRSAKCSHCKKQYAHCGNTSNLRKHLSHFHESKLQKTYEDDPENENPSEKDRQEEKPTIKTLFYSMKSYDPQSQTYKRILFLLQRFFVENCIPFEIVESESFQDLVNSLDKRVELPGRKKLTKTVDEYFDRIKTTCIQELENQAYFSLTTDAWTDPLNTTAYLGVTLHFIIGDSLDSINVATRQLTESHTAHVLESTILAILDEWMIPKHKIIACVTDGAANMVKASHLLFTASRHLHCFAHNLNLVAKESIDNCAPLSSNLENVKAIVTHFKRSVNAADNLRKEQLNHGKDPLKLIQSCPTRWNSSYQMLKRYLDIHIYVAKAIMDGDFDLEIPSKHERDMLLECTELLAPLYEATNNVSSEKHVTASKIVPICKLLKLAVENVIVTFEATILLKGNILLSIKNRLEPLEEIKMLNICTILDPRFKTRPITNAVAKSEALRIINSEIKKQPTTTQLIEETDRSNKPRSFWDYYEQLPNVSNKSSDREVGYEPMLKQYLDQPPIDHNANPIGFWNQHKEIYKALAPVALKYLTIVVTSVPSERVFSKAGTIITKKRNRLAPKRAEKLIFLSSLSKKRWNAISK